MLTWRSTAASVNETRSVWPYTRRGEDEISHKIYSNMKNFLGPN